MVPLLERKGLPPWLRFFLRLPVRLYRAHFGWVLGSRFLLLTYRGRTSGLTRQGVLEVTQHDPTRHTYFIASGCGEK